MSEPKNPNAFPACNEANVNDTMGMSLRDWFAGQVMMGLMSGPDGPLPYGTSLADWRAEVAANAYAWADAMLSARGEA